MLSVGEHLARLVLRVPNAKNSLDMDDISADERTLAQTLELEKARTAAALAAAAELRAQLEAPDIFAKNSSGREEGEGGGAFERALAVRLAWSDEETPAATDPQPLPSSSQLVASATVPKNAAQPVPRAPPSPPAPALQLKVASSLRARRPTANVRPLGVANGEDAAVSRANDRRQSLSAAATSAAATAPRIQLPSALQPVLGQSPRIAAAVEDVPIADLPSGLSERERRSAYGDAVRARARGLPSPTLASTKDSQPSSPAGSNPQYSEKPAAAERMREDYSHASMEAALEYARADAAAARSLADTLTAREAQLEAALRLAHAELEHARVQATAGAQSAAAALSGANEAAVAQLAAELRESEALRRVAEAGAAASREQLATQAAQLRASEEAMVAARATEALLRGLLSKARQQIEALVAAQSCPSTCSGEAVPVRDAAPAVVDSAEKSAVALAAEGRDENNSALRSATADAVVSAPTVKSGRHDLSPSQPPQPQINSMAVRGASATPLFQPLRRRSTAPVRQANHRRVASALSGVLLAGPHQAERLSAARAALAANVNSQVLVLLVSNGGGGAGSARGALAGLYAVIEDDADASALATALAALPGTVGAALPPAAIFAARIFGTGPPCITAPMVNALLKFDTVSRAFGEIASHTLTHTTDAVTVDSLHAQAVR